MYRNFTPKFLGHLVYLTESHKKLFELSKFCSLWETTSKTIE